MIGGFVFSALSLFFLVVTAEMDPGIIPRTNEFEGAFKAYPANNRTTDVNVVKWFPDGISFVAGCDDGTVRLFDIRTGSILNEYSYHRNYLLSSPPNSSKQKIWTRTSITCPSTTTITT
jgi:WD40 repeat protein